MTTVPAHRRPLIDALESAGLTGRGGAAFPTHRKMLAVRAASSAAGMAPVVVANGAEGEPASRKDRMLLSRDPHLVLVGLQLASVAVEAREAVVYLHRDEALSRIVRSAVAERAATDAVPVRVVDAPPRFLAGEESTLVHVIEGGPALPRYSMSRVFESGVGGAPTLVQNVETLARMALIVRDGPDAATKMFTTLYDGRRAPKVCEIRLGTPLRDLVDVSPESTGAVLVGGYHGAWIAASDAARLRLCDDDLRPYGAAVGAGLVVALPADRCGVAETAGILRYLAAESAGQCGPCLNGLPRIATAWQTLARPRPADGVRADLERWAGLVERRGACRHPDGSVRLARSALTVFADEIARHSRGECSGWSPTPFLPVPDTIPDHDADWR